MSYKKLYEYSQTLAIPVHTNDIKKKAEELCGERVQRIRSTMDPAHLQGFFLSARNLDHRLVQQCGGANVIVTPRACEKKLERFIFAKELMHLFDTELEHTNTGADLEDVLLGFCERGVFEGKMSPQFRSEILCQFMAAGVLCSEKRRVELVQAANGGGTDLTGIASELQIPEKYVSIYFIPDYKGLMSFLLDR